MRATAPRVAAAAFAAAAVVAVWMRVHNAFAYPADWGFDAAANWQYIVAVARTGRLPPPDAGWSASDPPAYFFLAAGLVHAFPGRLVLVPLLNVLLGLGIAALAMDLVRRLAPGDRVRPWLAGGLVLFLPAHAHMSAMVNEEMLAAFCASLAVWAVARHDDPGPARVALAGAAAGLALLTKLSGLLVGAAVAGALGLEAARRGAWRGAAARVAGVAVLVLAVGGWYFVRSRILYGWFHPFALPAHEVMFDMPPGERGLLDFLRFPLAVFLDPQVLHPDLLRSVWGTTYASVWFDAHRFFLPTDSAAVRRLGTTMTILGLVPTLAFATGLARGARRWWQGGGRADAPLLLLVALTLAGYAVFAWRNPWFAVLKGTTLLGLSLPFAVYASEALLDWARRSRTAAIALGAAALLGLVGVTVSCTFGGWFERTEVSGIPWEDVRSP